MDHSMHSMHDMAATAATGFDFTLAFMTGVLGSGHCLGMCGALVSGYFMNAGKSHSYFPFVTYHLGRISVYALIGLAAAALGFVLVASGLFGKIQSIMQMLIGFAVIILALGILGLIPFQGSFHLISMKTYSQGYAATRKKGPVLGALMAGFLNGLMPCPLTFAMAVQATSAVNIVDGGLLMMAFGAGTLPTMLFITIVFGKLAAKVRGIMYKLAALMMIFMGLNTFYKGLSFFTEEDFKHRTFFHVLKEKIDDSIVLLSETIHYINQLISNIQNM